MTKKQVSVDEKTYEQLKSEAQKYGLKIGVMASNLVSLGIKSLDGGSIYINPDGSIGVSVDEEGSEGAVLDKSDLIHKAEKIAKLGTREFKPWFDTLGKAERKMLKDIEIELTATASCRQAYLDTRK